MKINELLSRHQKKLWLLPVLLGVLLLVLTVRNRQAPQRLEARMTEAAYPVRVATARPAEETPWVRGFGTVEPARVWYAAADVSGRIVEIHPRLKEGARVRRNEVLLRIDSEPYRLMLKRQEADLVQVRADLRALHIRESGDRNLLNSSTRSLRLYEKDLKRYRNLLAEGAVSRSEVEAMERTVLNQRQKVQDLEKALSTVPAEEEALLARIDGLKAAVRQAELDLEHSTVRAPFDGRIAGLAVEHSQFVPAGQQLFRLEDASTLEINVQLGMDKLAALAPAGEEETESPAEVLLQGATGEWYRWKARFDRYDHRVDPTTRTAGIVVTVNDPLSLEGRLSLMSGMYCEVRIMGEPVPGLLALPREALRNGQVYRVNGEDRLEYRDVKVLTSDADEILVMSGLEKGDRVVLSDLTPAVPGMKLRPLQQACEEETEGTLPEVCRP